MSDDSPIAARLIAWHARHGRHDLPWQRERTAYRVWVSEIMLQQTQVATVIPYYERFMQRFPDVCTLAAAPIDDVLHLWTGLGYYARARNLHRAAQLVHETHGGEFPRDIEQVAALPGIGRSTAGAILALSADVRAPILDGNARRVLARFFAVEGSPAERVTQQELWRHAERCTPASQVAIYTQSIMDLGATLCVRRRPLCALCPLTADCAARRSGRQHELPAPRPARARRSRTVTMLVAMRADGSVRLEQRAARGIWGGLWCLPEFDSRAAAQRFVANSLGVVEGEPRALAPIEHAFTHFDLLIEPLLVRTEGAVTTVMDEPATVWYNPSTPARVGLPAPIRTLLQGLAGLDGREL